MSRFLFKLASNSWRPFAWLIIEYVFCFFSRYLSHTQTTKHQLTTDSPGVKLAYIRKQNLFFSLTVLWRTLCHRGVDFTKPQVLNKHANLAKTAFAQHSEEVEVIGTHNVLLVQVLQLVSCWFMLLVIQVCFLQGKRREVVNNPKACLRLLFNV